MKCLFLANLSNNSLSHCYRAFRVTKLTHSLETWILNTVREVEFTLWKHVLCYLLDVATAGKPIPNVLRLASTGPFFLPSVIADSKLTTAAVFLVKFPRGGG